MERSGEPLAKGDVTARITAPSGKAETVRFTLTGDEWGAFTGHFHRRRAGQARGDAVLQADRRDARSLVLRAGRRGRARRPAGPAGGAGGDRPVTRGKVIAAQARRRLCSRWPSFPSPRPSVRRVQLWSHPARDGRRLLHCSGSFGWDARLSVWYDDRGLNRGCRGQTRRTAQRSRVSRLERVESCLRTSGQPIQRIRWSRSMSPPRRRSTMSLVHSPDQLHVPATLETQLLDFRRRVWTIKMIEAVGAPASASCVAYLVMFALDRVWDTPGRRSRWPSSSRRWLACMIAPVFPAPLGLAAPPARTAGPAAQPQDPADRRPVAGDHRAGAQRLRAGPLAHACARPRSGRSPTTPQQRDFSDAVPNPRHRLWGWLSGAAFLSLRSACSASSPPRPPTPGRGSSPPGATRPATRSPAIEPLPDRSGRRARRAVHRRRQADRRQTAGSPAQASAQLGDSATASPPTLDDERYTRSSCRRRSNPVQLRSVDRRLDARRFASSRCCAPS